MKWSRAGLFFLAFFLTGFNLDEPIQPHRLIDSLAPYERHSNLPGHSTGLLVQEIIKGIAQISTLQSVWWDGHPMLKEQNNAYSYRLGTDSPFATYFLSPTGLGFDRQENFTQSVGYTATAARFAADTPNEFGLSRSAHIVEVEVNGGKGTNKKAGVFIVTGARLLDNTAEYPINPANIIEQALAPYEARTGKKLAEIDTKLKTAVFETNRDIVGNPERSEFDAGFTATWIAQNASLRVGYYRRFQQTFTSQIAGQNSGLYEITIQVGEYAIRWDFDHKGRLSETEEFEIKTYRDVHTVDHKRRDGVRRPRR